MRLSQVHVEKIKTLSKEVASQNAKIYLFGSRADDAAKGGDLDLMLELDHIVEHPAQLSAELAAKISRFLEGRKVDILLLAPNLQRLPIHDVAKKEGILL